MTGIGEPRTAPTTREPVRRTCPSLPASPSATRLGPPRRRPRFWLLVAAATVFMSLEPSLFLVTLALGLFALALFWVLLLARLLVSDALAYATRPHATAPDRNGPAGP